MKKATKILIIVLISLYIVVSSVIGIAIVLGGIAFGGLTIFNMSKPDNSDDELIPSGYVQTDGLQSYGAGDWIFFSYFKYDKMPRLNSCFKEVTNENSNEPEEVFRPFKSDISEDKGPLDTSLLSGRISNDDYYYIESYNKSKKGAFIYYYDTEENILFKLDYGF